MGKIILITFILGFIILLIIYRYLSKEYCKTLKGSKWVLISYNNNPWNSSNYLIVKDYKKGWVKVDIYNEDLYKKTVMIPVEVLMFNYRECE